MLARATRATRHRARVQKRRRGKMLPQRYKSARKTQARCSKRAAMPRLPSGARTLYAACARAMRAAYEQRGVASAAR